MMVLLLWICIPALLIGLAILYFGRRDYLLQELGGGFVIISVTGLALAAILWVV